MASTCAQDGRAAVVAIVRLDARLSLDVLAHRLQ
jgi:hypothetical protein